MRKRSYNIELLRKIEEENNIQLSYQCKEDEIFYETILTGKCRVEYCEKIFERDFRSIIKKTNFKCNDCCQGVPTRKALIKLFDKIFDNKYDYSKMDYRGNEIKIIVICKLHKIEFEITPASHKKGHQSCSKCIEILRNNNKIKLIRSQQEFIILCEEKHDYYYDYSPTIYNGSKKDIKVKCPKHGEFEILADSHLCGHGCLPCSTEKTHDKQKIPLETFIEKAISKFGNTYSYKFINNKKYNGIGSEVLLLCNKHNVYFKQIAYLHLRGFCGCNECKKEKQDMNVEDKIINNIEYNTINNLPWFLNKKGNPLKGVWGRGKTPNLENHKKYALWLGEKLKFKKPEHWYKISLQLFTDNYGEQVIRYYNYSPLKFLEEIFPDIKWHPFLLSTQVPNGHWKNKDNHIKFIEYFAEQMKYKNPEDWYNVSYNDIMLYGGGTLIYLTEYGSLKKLITSLVSPSYEWDLSKFKQKGYSKIQIEWLEFKRVSVPDILHALNSENGEFRIIGTNFKADGYSELENCIYEFHGDYWHGNPYIYNSTDINPTMKKSYGELYDNTLKKKNICETKGFKYESVWEHDWRRGINSLKMLQRKLRKFN